VGAGLTRVKARLHANGSIDDPATALTHVAAGWHIEKGDGSPQFGPVNREQWDWPRFLELLGQAGRPTGHRLFRRHALTNRA
jgi:hypothetical protein